jgi:hypothetical protein
VAPVPDPLLLPPQAARSRTPAAAAAVITDLIAGLIADLITGRGEITPGRLVMYAS